MPMRAFFKGVNANDITDNLTVKVISVNGIDTERASRNGYIKISSVNPSKQDWEVTDKVRQQSRYLHTD
jgi:hypothetical protein